MAQISWAWEQQVSEWGLEPRYSGRCLDYGCFNDVFIMSGLFALQHVPKPGHKRTDSTHSSNESEYTFSSELAETEDIPLRTEVQLDTCH